MFNELKNVLALLMRPRGGEALRLAIDDLDQLEQRLTKQLDALTTLASVAEMLQKEIELHSKRLDDLQSRIETLESDVNDAPLGF